MTIDIDTFLQARVNDDERLARGAAAWYGNSSTPSLAPHWREVEVGHIWNEHGGGIVDADNAAALPHIARWDPQRALDEVNAKRTIMAIHRADPATITRWRPCKGCQHDQYGDPEVEDINRCHVLRALAGVYSEHPDYQPTWELRPGDIELTAFR